MTIWTVPGRIVRVTDGDTLIADLDLGWRISLRSSIRLLGINAPELSTAAGKVAAEYLRGLAPPGEPVTVVSRRLLGQTEKYGRVLAGIVLPSGEDLSTVMVAAGHAVTYPT